MKKYYRLNYKNGKNNTWKRFTEKIKVQRIQNRTNKITEMNNYVNDFEQKLNIAVRNGVKDMPHIELLDVFREGHTEQERRSKLLSIDHRYMKLFLGDKNYIIGQLRATWLAAFKQSQINCTNISGVQRWYKRIKD